MANAFFSLIEKEPTGGGGGGGPASGITYTGAVPPWPANPTNVKVALDWLAESFLGTPHEIWVDYSATPTYSTGTQAFPFKDMASAIVYANALAGSQPFSGLIINVEALPPATTIASFTLPQNLVITLRGGVHNFPSIDSINMVTTTGNFCGVNLSNVNVNAINISGDNVGAGFVYIISDLCNISNVVQDPLDLSQVICQVGGNTAPTEQSTWLQRASMYTVTLNNNSVFEASFADVQNITAGFFSINGCRISGDLITYTERMYIDNSNWTDNYTLRYLTTPGIIEMDAYSTYSYREKNVLLDPVQNIVNFDRDLAYTVTFTVTPVFDETTYGDIYQGPGNAVNLAEASADVSIVGVLVGDEDSLLTTFGRRVPVQLELGLTPTVGDIVYLSTIPGKGSIIEPSASYPLGQIMDLGNYDTVTGGYVWIIWQPNSLQRNKQHLLIAGAPSYTLWANSQFMGPGFTNSSFSNITGAFGGTGFCVVPKDGYIRNFKMGIASPPGVPYDIQIWWAPFSNPFLMSFTGITLSDTGANYVLSETTSKYTVSEGDLLVAYSPNAFNFYTGVLTITCDLYS